MRPPQSLVVSFLLSLVSTLVFSRTGGILSHRNSSTQFPSIATEELVLPRDARCVLSRLRCNEHSLLLSLYLSKIGRIENPSCSACRRSSQDTSALSSYRLCAAHSLATLCLSTPSGLGPGELPGFWGSMVFRHAPIPWKGSGNNSNNNNRKKLGNNSDYNNHLHRKMVIN